MPLQLLEKTLDWMGDHPVITVLILVLLLTGGISVSVHLGFETKLMPY